MTSDIFVYEAENGKSYFEEWFWSLHKAVRVRVQVRLLRVAAGNFGDSKPVGEGVVELRLHFGPGYRVYLGREGERVVLLLTGSEKIDQDTAIKKAKELWAEYKRGKGYASKAVEIYS